MAALTYFVGHMLYDLWSLTDAFVRNGGNLREALEQLHTRQREQEFQRLCRELYGPRRCRRCGRAILTNDETSKSHQPQQQQQPDSQNEATSVQNNLKSAKNNKKKTKANNSLAMHRNNIDLAAVDATAEEAFVDLCDNAATKAEAAAFGIGVVGQQRKQLSATASDHCCDFLNNERQQHLESDYQSDIEIIEGVEVDASFYDYFDAIPLYEEKTVQPLIEGISYTIRGFVLPDCERFSINFMLSENDIALHINPRLPQNYIVRNSKVHDKWGKEEVASPLPFTLHRGGKFCIQVLITDECFMISVNGYHFAKYNHRMPYSDITVLQIKGDIEQVFVEREIVKEYPERYTRPRPITFESSTIRPQIRKTLISLKNVDSESDDDNIDNLDITDRPPKSFRIVRTKSVLVPTHLLTLSREVDGYPLPFYGKLSEGDLHTGRCLKVEGRIKLLPHSFYINLQQGQNIWPHPQIAFHFNPRFSKHGGELGKGIVCRNAWFNGSWGEEERSQLDTDLRPGKMFQLAIVCAADAFEVYMNHKFITEFKYQLKPDIVDMVYIQGDIKLWNVSLTENPLLDDGKSRLYENPLYVDNF